MKKLLITSLLGLFGFVGAFASATDYTFVSSDTDPFPSFYSPDEITFNNSVSISSDLSSFVVSYVCKPTATCNFYLIDKNSEDEYGFMCYADENGHIDFSNYCFKSQNLDNNLIPAGVYYVKKTSDYAFSSITITDGQSSSGGGDNSGGDNSGGSLLPNGESDLSGIITGLNSTITEFIPYLVYLGLGIITVIIGFVAVRWLINRTQAKIRGTFSSGRRRR